MRWRGPPRYNHPPPFTNLSSSQLQPIPSCLSTSFTFLILFLLLHYSQAITKTSVRWDPHILLLRDPGTGKRQLLKYACKMRTRAVMTTGIGSVSTSRDKGSGIWRLELRFWRMEEGRNLGDEDLLQISDLQCQDPHCTLFLNTEMFVLWNILFLKY